MGGVAQAAKMTEIIDCIEESNQIGIYLRNAFFYLRRRSYIGVAKALGELKKALHEVPTIFKNCQASGKDIVAIEMKIAMMKKPKRFIVHLFKDIAINGVSIYHDVLDSIDAYKTHSFKQFGRALGNICEKVFIGKLKSTGPLEQTPKSKFAAE